MKKFLGLFLLLTGLLTLSACKKTEDPIVENEIPTITGALADVTIDLGETWNALAGVTAADLEDGDLTSSIVVTSLPNLTVTSGSLTPTQTGDYYITYSVEDAAGEVVEAYTTLKVMPVVSEKETFIDYLFVEGDAEFNDYSVAFESPAAGTFSADQGVLNINVTDNGDADWHAKFFKTNIAIEAGATYKFAIRMKASETLKLHYIINNAEAGWAPYGGSWNLEVGTDYAEYSIEFLADAASANAEFLLQFGGDTFDGYTNPTAFDLVIDYVEITKTVGTWIETAVITDDFEDGLTTGWAERGVESHTATITNVANALNFQVDAYPTDNNPWEMDLYLATDYDLVQGNSYKISFDYTSVNDQFYELCFEDSTMDWQVRAGFKNGTLTGTGTLEYTFIASMDITDLFIKLSVGKGAAATNTLTLDNVVLFELTGDQESVNDRTEFTPNADTIAWGTFNNEDEGAFGTVYAQDGVLVYEIASFGTTDWFNKLFIEDIDFTAGGLYTLEFTVKADKTVEALAGLNVTGQWDPRVWEAITITTTEQTFSFTMDDKLMFNMNFEMLFQFGFATNEGPAKIEFSSITILRQE